jgi:hypothetical protein
LECIKRQLRKGSKMICPNCGKNIPDTSERCSQCGQPTEFSSTRNQRPQAPFIRNLYDHPSGDNDTKEALEKLLAKSKSSPTVKEFKYYLRLHILISVIAIILVTGAGLSLILFRGGEKEPSSPSAPSAQSAIYIIEINAVDTNHHPLDGAVFTVSSDPSFSKATELPETHNGQPAVVIVAGNGSWWVKELQPPDGYTLAPDAPNIIKVTGNQKVSFTNQKQKKP